MLKTARKIAPTILAFTSLATVLGGYVGWTVGYFAKQNEFMKLSNYMQRNAQCTEARTDLLELSARTANAYAAYLNAKIWISHYTYAEQNESEATGWTTRRDQYWGQMEELRRQVETMRKSVADDKCRQNEGTT